MESQIIADLLAGKIVTVPTETVEGYAVSLNSELAIRRLMKLKDRNFHSSKVFTLVPENKSAISKYAIISDPAKDLIEKYTPGELTLILPKNPNFHHFITTILILSAFVFQTTHFSKKSYHKLAHSSLPPPTLEVAHLNLPPATCHPPL